MPTIPLYSSSPPANAKHGVQSPGGYERWNCEAFDIYRDIRITAAIYDGCPFHPEYLRRYANYLRHPTRVLPPLPREYPVVQFSVFRGRELLAEFFSQYPVGALARSVGAHGIEIGLNRLLVGENPQLKLSGVTSKKGGEWAEKHAGRSLEGDFVFAPLDSSAPLQELTYLSSEASCGATHRWLPTNLRYQVSGLIRCAGETVEFAGPGFHDRSYGTAPIGLHVQRILTGSIYFEDSIFTFQMLRPLNQELVDEFHLVEATSSEVREIPFAYADAKEAALTKWGLSYPREVIFEDQLTLSDPWIIDSTPFSMRLVYAARAGHRSGKAYCECVFPQRLGWPILRGMIGRSFDPVNVEPTI